LGNFQSALLGSFHPALTNAAACDRQVTLHGRLGDGEIEHILLDTPRVDLPRGMTPDPRAAAAKAASLPAGPMTVRW
jgi:hypothetical protein